MYIDKYNFIDYSYVRFYSINEKDKTVKLLHSYQGAKSRITSNWRADFDTRRVFFMGGYIAHPKQYDNQRGMFYEYDYDTEGVLNQYGSKYTFYRGYHFDVDLNTCSEELKVKDNYFCGTVNMSEKVSSTTIPEETLSSTGSASDVSFSIVGNILKINAFDHAVSKIEFIGKDNVNSYAFSLASTGDGEEKFKKLSYNISTSFQNLEPDEYTVVLTYYGKRVNTEQTITINK